MVRFPPRSALPEVEIAARNQLTLKWKTVDPTLYTNYKSHLLVICATVAQTECYKQVILHREGFTNRFNGMHMYVNVWLVLNGAKFEQNSTFGPRSLIFQVKVLLRSCDLRLSVIVTDVSITAAEIITRVDWTIVFYPSIRTASPTRPPTPPPSLLQQLWASVRFQISSIYSNRRASQSKL